MDNLKKERIILNYKTTIIKIFSVPDERAVCLAYKLFDIIEASGGAPGSSTENIDKDVRRIVGGWIENKVFLESEDK